MATSELVKLQAGGYKYPSSLVYDNGRIQVLFPYNKSLISEVKMMSGAKYHGYDDINPRKIWSVEDNPRNRFQLDYLQGKNPYAHYDKPLVKLPQIKRYNKSLQREVIAFAHQQETVEFILTRKQCIIAEEMGLGKTWAAIEAMERSGITDWWYVAPKGVLSTIMRELRIWGSWLMPRLMSYDELRELMKTWVSGNIPPKGLVLDECQRVKNPTAQRSQAAKALADGIRQHFGLDGYIIEMSGTPAPRSPEDWWHLCEIACPGFLKEGDIHKFRHTLGLIVQKSSTITGGVYPHLITWRDDERKCAKCGQLASHANHLPSVFSENGDSHDFIASVNEVKRLYKRLDGLVIVKMKKDCVDLPEKQYEVIELKPSASTLRVAAALTKTCPTAIKALTLLRELSDGFQYYDEKVSIQVCPECKGEKKIKVPVPIHESCPVCGGKDYETCIGHTPIDFEEPQLEECPNCKGSGNMPVYERKSATVNCPKDDLLKNLLDQHEDVGRFIVYGGFEATIDKIVKICCEQDWNVIREDGRGIMMIRPDGTPIPQSEIVGNNAGDKLLTLFQDMKDQYEKVVYVAQPESGGIGKTLTASPSEFFYSNSFNGEARSQAEDRHHRMGMDTNRGGRIIDCIHLPSDLKVLDNLKKKRNLELMSLGELVQAFEIEGERQV